MVMVRPYLVMVKALEDHLAYIKRLEEEREMLKRKLKESLERTEMLRAQLAELKERIAALIAEGEDRIRVLEKMIARKKKEEEIKFVIGLAVFFSIGAGIIIFFLMGAGICLFVDFISNLRKKKWVL